MRKLMITILLALLINIPLCTFAMENEAPPDLKAIDSYSEDVTGDGIKESIQLKGRPFSANSNYYQTIVASITSPDNQHWQITYGGGYEPQLQFIDLNHDKISDIFYQSSTGGSGGLYNYKLHTLTDGKLAEIPLPSQPNVSGSFKDGFKITLQLAPNAKPIVINIKDRAKDYTRLGIYNKEGKLLKTNLTPMIDPIAFFKPVLISKSKGYGLKGYKQVSGAYHADQLGIIESLWYYENGMWILLKDEWKPS